MDATSFQLLIAPAATLVAVWLTSRNQRKEKQEEFERTKSKEREQRRIEAGFDFLETFSKPIKRGADTASALVFNHRAAAVAIDRGYSDFSCLVPKYTSKAILLFSFPFPAKYREQSNRYRGGAEGLLSTISSSIIMGLGDGSPVFLDYVEWTG